MANFSTQTGNITDVTVTENNGVSNLTQTFGTVPPEQKAAVEKMTRGLQEEAQKPEATSKTLLDKCIAFAWENGPAFVTLIRMLLSKI